MANIPSTPGKVLVESVIIKTFNGAKQQNITKLIGSIDIYEDVRKPSIVVDLFIADAINLIESLPIIGEEKIEMVLSYPQGGTAKMEMKLVVAKVGDFIFDDVGKGQGYTLSCVSEDVWVDSTLNIMKGYKTTVGSIVQDVLLNQLGTTKPVNIEPTKGVQSFVVPRMTAFEVADMMRRRAVSATNPGSYFLFFENKKGYQFKSFEQLFKEGTALIESKKRKYYRGDVTHTPSDGKSTYENKYAFKSILAIHSNDRGSSANKIVSGALNSMTYSFDVATKTLVKIPFVLQQKNSSLVVGDTTGKSAVSNEFLAKYGSKVGVSFFVPTDSSKGENFIASTIGAKNAYETLINENNVVVEIPGDLELNAGDAVYLHVPQQTGTTDPTEKLDRYLSGTYVITALRHLIACGPNADYRISMQLAKGNYLSAI